MIKRIVITGATSSLGTALIDECINNNIEVLAIVNPGSTNISRITINENVRIVECSLEGLWDFKGDNTKYDVFVHLAWASTAGDNARNMLKPQALNVQYSLEAVDVAERLGCKVFIGAGSQAEYGRTDEVLTEETVTHPETGYGIAKLCAGQLTRIACRQKGIKHIWPRILSAYGPKCQPQSVLNYTLSELLAGRTPFLSEGDQIWDFIYTGDVARALLLLADKGRDGEIYVIGSGNSKPLKEYLMEARNVAAELLEREDIHLGLGKKPYTENTVMHLACDIGKLRQDTGFETRVSFHEGIEKTIKWIQECQM